MDTTRSSSSVARRGRLFRRGVPLAAAAVAALALTAGCTDGARQQGAPGRPASAHTVTVNGDTGTSGGSGSVTVDHGPDGSSVTVDRGPDGSSISVDGSSVHVTGGPVSVVRNPDGSLTVTRPGAPPITVPAGPHQGLSVSVDPSNGSSGSVAVSVGGGSSSVSVTR